MMMLGNLGKAKWRLVIKKGPYHDAYTKHVKCKNTN